MDHSSLKVTPIQRSCDREFQRLMQAHHYLGALPKIGHTIRYVATVSDQWLALLSFSAPALRCSARDEWIGWSYRHQFDRLNLVTNNSRFLILPGHHYPNLASRILSICRRRIQQDWLDYFSQPLLLLETFVDPVHYHGTIYRASNWIHVGSTKGYRRIRMGYSEQTQSIKWVFVQPLQRNTRSLLCRPFLNDTYQTGKPRMKLTADQMLSLYDFFKAIDDPRRAQGRKHHLTNVPMDQASAQQVLADNRGHWRVESCHYIIDWNYDEDRSQIRTGLEPENMTRLRRFAIGLLKRKQKKQTIPEMMKNPMRNTRTIFDYLKMTRNSNPRSTTYVLA